MVEADETCMLDLDCKLGVGCSWVGLAVEGETLEHHRFDPNFLANLTVMHLVVAQAAVELLNLDVGVTDLLLVEEEVVVWT
jgi:hypothetical protein